MIREPLHDCAIVRRAVRWVVYFHPLSEQDRQAATAVDTVGSVMHTGCGRNRPRTRKISPGSRISETGGFSTCEA